MMTENLYIPRSWIGKSLFAEESGKGSQVQRIRMRRFALALTTHQYNPESTTAATFLGKVQGSGHYCADMKSKWAGEPPPNLDNAQKKCVSWISSHTISSCIYEMKYIVYLENVELWDHIWGPIEECKYQWKIVQGLAQISAKAVQLLCNSRNPGRTGCNLLITWLRNRDSTHFLTFQSFI